MTAARPCRRTLPALLALLTLAVCLHAAAQNIAAPTADMLPTPEEVKNAPALPFTDGTHPNANQYRLPVEITAKDVSDGGDRVTDIVDGRPVPPGPLTTPPSSWRQREIMIVEYALTGPQFTRREAVFYRVLEINLRRYADPADAARPIADLRADDQARGRLGTTPPIGDDAYLGVWNTTGQGDVYLHVQQGPFLAMIKSHGVAALWQDKLRDLMTYTAELILLKLPTTGTVTPPVTTPPTTTPAGIEITAGPSGSPDPVAPGGNVQCSVQARHAQGLALAYQWTSSGGSFNNPHAPNPVWTAPAAGAAEYAVTVYVSAADGARIGASFLQRVTAAPAQQISVFIDGQLLPTQAPPVVANGRVLVGLTDIFVALGAIVTWDGADRRITATRGARVVQLWIGRTTALVDGVATTMDVAPMLLAGGTTYVQARFVSQALGAGIVYQPAQRAVLITTAGMPPAAPALAVSSPVDGATVPEQFTISGVAPPGSTVRVSVTAQATLKATGQHATSPIADAAQVTAGADGSWSVPVNARAVCRDQRVELQQLTIAAEMGPVGDPDQRVELTVHP